ncbi:MAG: hypothetical protein WCP39_06740 [Chlamydiota bacterium]
MKWFFPLFFLIISSLHSSEINFVVGANIEYGNVKATSKNLDISTGGSSQTTVNLSLTGLGGGVQGGGTFVWNAFYMAILGKIAFMDRKGKNFTDGFYINPYFDETSLSQKMKYGGEIHLGFTKESLFFALLGGCIQSKFQAYQGYLTTLSSTVHKQTDNKYPLGAEIGFVFGYDLPWHLKLEGLFSYIFYQTIHVKEIYSDENSLKFTPRESSFSIRLYYLF